MSNSNTFTPDILVRVNSQYDIEKDDVEIAVNVTHQFDEDKAFAVSGYYKDINSPESLKKFLTDIATAIHKVQA